MRHFFSIFTRAVAALLLVAGVTSASPITLSTPTGLNPGDKFRFLAVTEGTTSATSADITTYNTFVQNQLGDATYNNVAINWKAIGSTTSVNARDNVGGFGSLVPVYTPYTGTKLADDLTTNPTGLWGTVLNSYDLLAPPNETLTGSLSYGDGAWTGSDPDGTRSVFFGLGEDATAMAGATWSIYRGWIRGSDDLSSQLNRVYGLSEELTVGGTNPVPEIDPAGMGSVMALVTGALGLLERRRLSCLRS